jgi:hypothetical protein
MGFTPSASIAAMAVWGTLFGRRTSHDEGRYRSFVAEGKHQPSPWGQLKNQIYLGSEAFVDKMQRRLRPGKNLLIASQAMAGPPFRQITNTASSISFTSANTQPRFTHTPFRWIIPSRMCR